jgi:hypothetical protein
MPTFVRAYADHRGVVTDQADLKKMGGFFERFERLLLIYVGMLLSIAYESDAILAQAVALVAVLSNLAALQRTLFAVGYKKPAD